MESTGYRSFLQEGTRVLLVHDEHPHNQKTATVMHVLSNPSRAQAHQWYDIRFDDGTLGRFLERHLERIPEVEAEPPGQASAA